MNKTTWGALGAVALAASVGMYVVGSNSSHLSELADFFWAPIPLAVLALVAAARAE